ncbi:MAG: beta-propeller fold lactonase family protein [Burkholderiales bacterium]
MNAQVKLYSAVGEELTHFDVDVEALTLTKRKTIKVPAVVQYAWPHPSKRTLYVTTSNRGKGMAADHNHVSALRIDPASGELSYLGDPVPLWTRAVHLCLTADAQHMLNAHNLPHAGITVHRINADGGIGAKVKQPDGLKFGIYPHQVMVAPSTGTVMLVDRGNDAKKGQPEDPGALRLFQINNGVLSNLDAVAPNAGYGFGPRHLDFHPLQPWVYVSLERQDKLYMYRMQGDALEHDAAYTRGTLADPANVKPRQLAGTLHVHPNGRFVYLINRGDWTVDFNGRQVFGGGDNSIAVYAIDQKTGEPTLIQHADTHTYHSRTFAIDPSGRMMVVASNLPMNVRDGDKVVTEQATLSVLRVGSDGKLEFVRKYDVETNGKIHYWMGMFGLN